MADNQGTDIRLNIPNWDKLTLEEQQWLLDMNDGIANGDLRLWSRQIAFDLGITDAHPLKGKK